jgi:hypothetical protein
MVEKSSFSSINDQKLTRSWPLDWRGCFGQAIKWDASDECYRFELWAWPLETSHYDRPSREAIGVHDQKFGLWRLHTLPDQRLQFLYVRAALHLEAGPIHCVRGLKSSLVIGQKAQISPNPFTPRGGADLVV